VNRLIIIILCLTVYSCKRQHSIQGDWTHYHEEQEQSPFFPYRFRFANDTLLTIDQYGFKQRAKFVLYKNSLLIKFENGTKKEYSLSWVSDSIVRLGNNALFRTSKSHFSDYPSSELIGFQSHTKFRLKPKSSIIHLTKVGSSTKVVLNDRVTELHEIQDFFGGHYRPESVCLYLGRKIELEDLIEVYCWLDFSFVNRVQLVTYNEAFDEFYCIDDFVVIDNMLLEEFVKNNQKFSPYAHPAMTDIDSHPISDSLYIYNRMDFNINFINDTTAYIAYLSDEMDINTYLSITDQLSNRGNVTKIIKRLTTQHNMH